MCMRLKGIFQQSIQYLPEWIMYIHIFILDLIVLNSTQRHFMFNFIVFSILLSFALARLSSTQLHSTYSSLFGSCLLCYASIEVKTWGSLIRYSKNKLAPTCYIFVRRMNNNLCIKMPPWGGERIFNSNTKCITCTCHAYMCSVDICMHAYYKKVIRVMVRSSFFFFAILSSV